MQAGFSEIDITPPIGTNKIGWLKIVVGESVLDPLYARACVLQSGGGRVAFVQLDTLSVSRKQVAEIRRRVQERFDFPGGGIMVAATHNHAGPAVCRIGDVPADEAYVSTLTDKIVRCFGEALQRLQDAEIGFVGARHFKINRNRRVVLRSGITRTHGSFADPDALYTEGPVDPELFVLAVRARAGGAPLGCLINFTCHPADEGPTGNFSAGWPGVLADEMKRAGWPVPMFLQGALGNISTGDPTGAVAVPSMYEAGRLVAADAIEALRSATYGGEDIQLGSRSGTIQLPFREATEEQVRGTVRGAQRFIDPAIYDRGMPALLREIKSKGTQQAQVQVLFIGNYAFVAIPAELFVELGLQIKEHAHPRHALIVGIANGMVGYVPTREAFARGGYETTFAASSKLGPDAGELLVDCAVELLRAGPEKS